MLAHKARLAQDGSSSSREMPNAASASGPGPDWQQGNEEEQSLQQQLQQQLRLAAAALQNPRAAAQSGVFRPSHQLPTISIEQQVGRLMPTCPDTASKTAGKQLRPWHVTLSTSC